MDTTLDTSDWRLWVMCVVIIGCLAFWLIAVFRAARSSSTVAAGGNDSRGTADHDHPVTETTIPTGLDAQVPAEPYQHGSAEPYRHGPAVPWPAPDRDTSVPMPGQRAGSAADDVRPASRP